MAAPHAEPTEIRLRFSGVTRPHGVFVGPAPWFRLMGTAIFQGPSGDPIAVLRDDRWIVRDLVFNRLDCRQPHDIRFETAEGDRAEAVGQFGECALIGGVIIAEGAPVATWVTEAGAWISDESGERWPVVIISASAPPRDYPFRYPQPGPGARPMI